MQSRSEPDRQQLRSPSGRRSRTGCATCRRRKKKCNLEYPICGQCLRLNLVCQREEPRVYTIPQDSTTRSGSPPSTTLVPPLIPPLVPSQRPGSFWVNEHDLGSVSANSRRHIMRYYTQAFTKFLTTNVENDAFLTVFIPIAFQHPVVVDALVAWAAGHLALRDTHFETIAAESRCIALKGFHDFLNEGHAAFEAQLTVCMVFCSMDSIAVHGKWFAHLEGASATIQSLRASPEDHISTVVSRFQHSSDIMWLLRNFAYHDIMMAVSMDRMPLCTTKEFLQSGGGDAIDPYFGVAAEILASMLDICALNETLSKRKSTTSHSPEQEAISTTDLSHASDLFEDINEISSAAHSIATTLRAWEPPSNVDPTVAALGEAYRSAALIYLYRTIKRHIPDLRGRVEGRIATQVDLIVQVVGQMPEGCLPECTLLFPLFLAGSEAVKQDEIMKIRQRTVKLAKSRSFHNVERALSVLDELWRQRELAKTSSTSRTIGWLDVVRRRNMELSLS